MPTQGATGVATSESGESVFRLTPFLSIGKTPSPWSLIDWNKVPGTTPTPTQASVHKLERNQFESSFGAAIYEPHNEGAAVPQLVPAKTFPTATGGRADRVVPGSAATSVARKSSKGGATGGRAGKTSKAKAGASKKRTSLSEKERREKRREQNRRNAAKCRQRKLDRVSVLSDELDQLREENDALRKTLEQIEKRLGPRAHLV